MKVCSNSLIYLKLYFRSIRNPRFGKLTKIEVKRESKFSSFNLKQLVWLFSRVFHFWSKHQQLGFVSSQHSCFLWQTTNCFPICIPELSFPFLSSFPFPGQFVLASMEMFRNNCIPEVISMLEVNSISWTFRVGKHGNEHKPTPSGMIRVASVESLPGWTTVTLWWLKSVSYTHLTLPTNREV